MQIPFEVLKLVTQLELSTILIGMVHHKKCTLDQAVEIVAGQLGGLIAQKLEKSCISPTTVKQEIVRTAILAYQQNCEDYAPPTEKLLPVDQIKSLAIAAKKKLLEPIRSCGCEDHGWYITLAEYKTYCKVLQLQPDTIEIIRQPETNSEAN